MIDRASFCSLPWTGIDISPEGSIKPCCKFSTVIGTSFAEYDESEMLKQVKQTFLDGGKPPQCGRCWQDEAAGLPSKRQIDHMYVLEPDTTLDHVKIIALNFGNICNLACVTCHSRDSSRWAIEERKLVHQFEHLKLNGHTQHYRNSEFVDQIIDRCVQLRHLEINGGEPFLSDRDLHLNLLSRIPNPHLVKIHYTTNSTIFPDPEFWSVWKKFRHVDIQLSLDATEKKFEYLRYPAEWSSVWHNVQQYRERCEIQISISHTLSWINVLDLDDFITWCIQENLPRPYIGTVSRPGFLGVKSLPLDVKQQVRDHLATSRHPETEKIVNYMFEEQHTGFTTGIRWLQALDQLRNTDYTKIFPELAGMIDRHTN